MDSMFKNNSGQPAYIQMYNYFRNLILSGALPSGSKLPSIRSCASQFSVSKTTVESAYVQLEAEGCIYSVAQSGFFVSEISRLSQNNITPKTYKKQEETAEFIYDFTSSAADEESFDFNLWQRYIKSALRTGVRLLDYGDPQGEEDLRKALCSYVSRSRGIICNESQIVVGAGVQNLLQLLCALEREKSSVLFLGQKYPKGEQIFKDYGKKIFNSESYDIKAVETFPDIDAIYTCPSHINYMGDVLPLSKRIDLLKYARKNDCLIIEDDFDSEFSYTGYPVPSLRSLDDGNNVVYIGTFSKLLIPSIRISFMVLTADLVEKYSAVSHLYNQTASKTEQIALCRYISDGHLYSRIKKTKKLYAEKTKLFYNSIKNLETDDIKIKISSSGFFVSMKICAVSREIFEKEFVENGMKVRLFDSENDELIAVFSVFSLSSENISQSAKCIEKTVKKIKKM